MTHKQYYALLLHLAVGSKIIGQMTMNSATGPGHALQYIVQSACAIEP
jgi:hypothetical protein